MTPDQIKRAFRSVLTEERLLDSFAGRAAPPNDVEAERVALGALLAEEVEPTMADELDPDDFFIPLHRWAFSRFLDGARGFPEFQQRAQAQGIIGPRFDEELEQLWLQPVILVPPMLLWVNRIKEAADRRRIFEACQRCVVGLRGDMTADEARRELRKLAL